ncbi:MAG: Sec-independent protein translocase protein TatC [Vicingaceae bacterium]|nr:MAG: Sec-independent protein translocase protein TatC [Vicingaceae bacterium]
MHTFSFMADSNQQSFLSHLQALRKHLIRSIVAVLALSITAFIYKDIVFDLIILGPTRQDFWTYEMFCRLSNLLGLGDALCIGKTIDFKLVNITMSGQFTMHLFISLIAGVVAGFPYVFWEFWRFVKEGLTPEEIKFAQGIVFWGSVLFLLGILFGYYVITPLSVQFLANYRVSEMVENTISLQSYISSVAWITLSCGIVFLLPMFVYFLSKIGLVNASFLKHYRKHAIVVILVIAAIITPPDVTSQILVSLPLFLLYEISILIAKKVNS